MRVGLWYWLILILCAVFGGWNLYSPTPRVGAWTPLVILILFGLIGYAVFGSPIK